MQQEQPMSGITPLDLKVLIKPDEVQTKTAGGVLLPDQTVDKQQYATTKATILAVGANAFKEWGEGNGPQPGDRVVTAQYAGLRVEAPNGEKLVLCNDADVIAILKEDA